MKYVVRTLESLLYIANNKAPCHIKLLNNITSTDGEDAKIKDAKDISIDFNGFTLYGCTLLIKSCKHMKLCNGNIIRGLVGDDPSVGDCLKIDKSESIYVEDMKISQGSDETVSICDSRYVSFYHVDMYDPIDDSRDSDGNWLHPDKCKHGYGMLIRGSQHVDVYLCSFDGMRKRSPSISPDGKYPTYVVVRYCNVSNWIEHGMNINDGGSDQPDEDFNIYFENNVFDSNGKDQGPRFNFESPQNGHKTIVRLVSNDPNNDWHHEKRKGKTGKLVVKKKK